MVTKNVGLGKKLKSSSWIIRLCVMQYLSLPVVMAGILLFLQKTTVLFQLSLRPVFHDQLVNHIETSLKAKSLRLRKR